MERIKNGRSEQKSADTQKAPSEILDLNKRLQYFFLDDTLIKLARDLDVDPRSGKTQQDVLREYVKQIVGKILPAIQFPHTAGVLLDPGYPEDIYAFERQLGNVLLNLDKMTAEDDPRLLSLNCKISRLDSELEKLEDEDSDSGECAGKKHEFEETIKELEKKRGELKEIFSSYEYLINRVRKDILRLIKEELETRGLEDKVIGIMGRFHGKGGIGEIDSCRIGDRNIAIKRIFNSIPMCESGKPLKYSADLLAATRESKNLVGYFGSSVIKDEKGEFHRIYSLEELTGAVDLDKHLKAVIGSDPEKFEPLLKVFFKTIFLPVLKGVKALHDKNLVHCDIKPKNILVCPAQGLENQELGYYSEIKLGDYDLVRNSGYTNKTLFPFGTDRYMSPEQLLCAEITCKSDIYSLGMMLYWLLSDELPWDNDAFFELQVLASEGMDVSDISAPEDLKKIIGKCLKTKPEERPDIDELIRDIEEYIEGKEEDDRILQAM